MRGTQLKYLYLLFSEESLIPLSEYVFNTEACPLLSSHPVFASLTRLCRLTSYPSSLPQ